MDEPKPYDKQELYNQKIAPLVDQLFEICKAEDLPLVLYIQVAINDQPQRGVCIAATINLKPPQPDARLFQMVRLMEDSGVGDQQARRDEIIEFLKAFGNGSTQVMM